VRDFRQPEFEKESNDMIFGSRAILESVKAGKQFEKVLVQAGLKNDLINEVLNALKTNGIAFQYVPQEKLNRITRKNHQGVVAFLSIISYSDIEEIVVSLFEKGENPLILVLDSITDVRNFGAICRSAECAGVHAIVVPEKGSAQINGDAMKTSAGALNLIPICKVNNLKKTIQYLQQSGISVFACSEKAAKNIYEAEMKGPAAVVMGSEDVGISNEIIKIVDEMVKIPMHGKIESLNVSVATGIFLFEVLRQRI
jgi:23S rRNA (guanosine2251-2'-O)-methyltransferase